MKPALHVPRILVEVSDREDRERLQQWLGEKYTILATEPQNFPSEHFDLAVVDSPALKQIHAKIRSRRKAEQPVFLPFIFVASRRKGGRPTRHLGRLVDDLILRPIDHDELQARVANLLRMRRFSLELKKEHDRVVKLAVTDDVSGFHNTRYLHRYLERRLSAIKEDERLALAFFDLDNFKSLVDAHGHLLGSKALREVAHVVHDVLHEDDRLVRYGGDEFIVILPRQNKEQALAKVQQMKAAINAARFLKKEKIHARLTASFGLAVYPDDARDKHELLAAADDSLFRSKSEGKNRISLAETSAFERQHEIIVHE
jgi:two-component system, cell cycle response regulator